MSEGSNVLLTYEDIRNGFNNLSIGNHTRITFLRNIRKIIKNKDVHINHNTILNFVNRTMNRLPNHPFDITLKDDDFILIKKRNMSQEEEEILSIPEEIWKKRSYENKYNIKL